MAFLKDKKTRTLILIMSVLVVVGLLISRSYYKSVNKSVDPRVVPAREMYARYNSLAVINDFEGIFFLLDSIENIYNAHPHYENSFEVGVLYNNRAAALLTMAMHNDSIVINSKFLSKQPVDTLLSMAQIALDRSIRIYEEWLAIFGVIQEPEIEILLRNNFQTGLEDLPDEEKERYRDHRLKEIIKAQVECPRRLSVSHTNLGIIYRNRNEFELAIEQYTIAIELWDRNLVAENNINILLGRPIRKRNIIQKLFPPRKGK